MAAIDFSPASGAPGTTVTISGSSLTGAKAVAFNGVAAATFTVDSDTKITAISPSGATTGPIAVTTTAGVDKSTSPFVVPITVTPGNPLHLPGPSIAYDEIDIVGGKIYAEQATTVVVNVLKKLG